MFCSSERACGCQWLVSQSWSLLSVGFRILSWEVRRLVRERTCPYLGVGFLRRKEAPGVPPLDRNEPLPSYLSAPPPLRGARSCRAHTRWQRGTPVTRISKARQAGPRQAGSGRQRPGRQGPAGRARQAGPSRQAPRLSPAAHRHTREAPEVPQPRKGHPRLPLTWQRGSQGCKRRPRVAAVLSTALWLSSNMDKRLVPCAGRFLLLLLEPTCFPSVPYFLLWDHASQLQMHTHPSLLSPLRPIQVGAEPWAQLPALYNRFPYFFFF